MKYNLRSPEKKKFITNLAKYELIILRLEERQRKVLSRFLQKPSV